MPRNTPSPAELPPEEAANSALISEIAKLALNARQYGDNYIGRAADRIYAPDTWSFQSGHDQVSCFIRDTGVIYPDVTVVAAYSVWSYDLVPTYKIEEFDFMNKSWSKSAPKYRCDMHAPAYSVDGRTSLKHVWDLQQPTWNAIKQSRSKRRETNHGFFEQVSEFNDKRLTRTRLEYLRDRMIEGFANARATTENNGAE